MEEFQQFIIFLIDFIKSPLNVCFVIAFLLAGYFYNVRFAKQIKEKQDLLGKSLTILSKYNGSNIQEGYNALDAELSGDSLLNPVWKKYKKTLAFITKDGEVRMYSTVDASEYLHSSALLGGLRAGFWSGLAGLFTGLGILGTFVGLTVGMARIDPSSTSNLSNSITNLLGGMSTAFVTSLLGIAFAIVAGYKYHKLMDDFCEKVEEIADKLDAIFQRTNAESIMLIQLEEIRQERMAIQSLSTQMAVALCDRLPDVLEQMADRMDQAVKGNLDTMLDGLSTKMDEQTGKLGEVAKHTEALANGFGNAINENAGEEAKALGNSLLKLSGEINELTGSVKAMITEAQNTATKANEEMIQAVREAVANLDHTMEGILAKQTAKTDENIQKMTGFMEEMKDTMADIFAKMSSSAEQQAKSTTDAIAATQTAADENLAHVNSTVKELMAQIANQMAAMQALVDAQQKNMDGTLDKMRSAVDSSSDVVESAGKAVAEFGSAAKDTREQFAMAAREAAGTIKEAAEPFTEAARPLKDAAASVDGSLKTLQAAMQLHSDTTAKAANEMKAMVEGQELSAKNIQESLEAVKKAWQAYEENFKGVNDGMTAIFANLQKGLKDYNAETSDGLQQALEAFDGGFAKVVDRLASISADAAEPIEDLQESIDRLSDNIKKIRR